MIYNCRQHRLTARVLLYAPSHRQDNTYHSLCYTSRGALAGTRNSSSTGNEMRYTIVDNTDRFLGALPWIALAVDGDLHTVLLLHQEVFDVPGLRPVRYHEQHAVRTNDVPASIRRRIVNKIKIKIKIKIKN